MSTISTEDICDSDIGAAAGGVDKFQCVETVCISLSLLWCACGAGLFISWVFFRPVGFFSLGGVGLTLLNLSIGPQLKLAIFLLCDVSGV